MNDCANAGANLSGNFATNPCDLTAINSTFDFDNYVGSQQKIYYGGQQVRDHLEEWWTKYFLPDFKSMAKQLTASLIEQTRQFGTMIDSQNITRTGGSLEKAKLDRKRQNDPSEQACVSGSAVTAISKANSGSNALAIGLTKDITKLSSNVVPTPTSATATTTTTTSTSTTPPTISPAEDQKKRWDEYCAEFVDQDNNNGVNACPPPTTAPDESAREDEIANGDIAVEGILLADTIYLKDPHQSKAAWALLRNLVYPKISERIPDSVVNTATGREAILAQQHLDSARNIAANVVSSIIARRASIPSTAPETKPDEDAKDEVVEGGSDDASSYALKYARSFLPYKNAQGIWAVPGSLQTATLTQTYCHRLAMYGAGGNAPLGQQDVPGPFTDLGRQYKAFLPANSYDAWKIAVGKKIAYSGNYVAPGGTQPEQTGTYPPPEGAMVFFMKEGSEFGHTGIYSGNNKFISVLRHWYPPCDPQAHPPLTEGCAKPTATPPPYAKPAIPTMATVREEYLKPSNWWPWYLGYVIPPNNGESIPPGLPQSPGVNIRDIRVKAGVDEVLASSNPSYNEIMVAMTKERFIDPEYFIKMQGNTGSIKQEQTAINAYITMQYQDIYRLQEQINALLAARASLKFDSAPKSSQTSSVPMTKPSQ
jgi:cell wall-associated NlpC family hydrolase